MDLPQRAEQFFPRRLFQQITGGPRGQRVVNVVRILINREHDELGCRQSRLQSADRLDSVHAGQVDVHQHHVRFLLRQELQRALGIAPVTREPKAGGAADPARNDLSRLRVVFDNRNGNCHGSLITQSYGE